jgi:hypothetical protein
MGGANDQDDHEAFWLMSVVVVFVGMAILRSFCCAKS